MIRDLVKSFFNEYYHSKNYVIGLIFEIPSSKGKLPRMSREVSPGFASLRMQVTSVQASRDLSLIIFYSVV